MKKLRIIKEGLIGENFYSNPLENLKGIKVNEEQAMRYSFFEEDASFEELVDKYGGHKCILAENEFYDGFCILCDKDCNYLVRLQGSIEQLNDPDECPNLALNNAKLYKICYDTKEQTTTGYAKDVYALGIARIEIVEFCSEDMANIIRQKLVEGAISGDIIELTDEEYKIITTYFFKSDISRLFEIIE